MKKILIITLVLIFVSLISGQSSKFVETNNLKIHYLELGEGEETIFLLHGLYDTAETWQDLAPLLAKNYRVIAPDRRGSGLTQKVLMGYEIKTLADDLDKLAKNLNINNFHLVGHSAGGNTAMTYTAMFPEKVKSLVLLEGGFWKKRKPGKIQDCPKPFEKECLINNTSDSF